MPGNIPILRGERADVEIDLHVVAGTEKRPVGFHGFQRVVDQLPGDRYHRELPLLDIVADEEQLILAEEPRRRPRLPPKARVLISVHLPNHNLRFAQDEILVGHEPSGAVREPYEARMAAELG